MDTASILKKMNNKNQPVVHLINLMKRIDFDFNTIASVRKIV